MQNRHIQLFIFIQQLPERSCYLHRFGSVVAVLQPFRAIIVYINTATSCRHYCHQSDCVYARICRPSLLPHLPPISGILASNCCFRSTSVPHIHLQTYLLPLICGLLLHLHQLQFVDFFFCLTLSFPFVFSQSRSTSGSRASWLWQLYLCLLRVLRII